MLELFKAEFIRYRNWAIFGLIQQLFVLSFFAKLGPVLEPLNSEMSLIIIVVCFAFGFIQMMLHKRKNHWTFLLQRPLKASQIYLALATAGIMNVLIAVPIAWLITVVGFDFFTDTIIDMRHYSFGFFLAAIGIITYLMGSLAALNASRAAILTGVGLFVIFQNLSEYIWLQSSAALLIILYLAYLNISSFKPDLTQPIKSRLSMAMLLVPMQMMLVLLLIFSTQIFYHLPKLMLVSSPSELIVEGTIDYWRDLPAEKRVDYLLKDSAIADKSRLSRQAELATADVIYRYTRSFGKKGQYPFRDKSFSLEDKENNNLWVFSHDKMLLQGVSKKNGKVVGWLGKQGFIENVTSVSIDDRFNSVPFMLENRFITTNKTIYRVDFDAKALFIKAQIPDGELMIGRPQFTNGYVALVTYKQSYLFEPADLFNGADIALPAYALPHPRELTLIEGIDTYAMVDGLLLIYRGQNYNGFDQAGAEVIYAKRDEGVKSIYNYRFEKHNYPDLIRHFEYLMSPLLHTLDASINYALRGFAEQEHPIMAVFSGDMLMSVNVWALILHILSIAIVFWVSKLIRLNTKHSRFWLVITGLIGFPALLSFLLVNKIRGNIFSAEEVNQLPTKSRTITPLS